MPSAVFASAKPHGTRAFARLFVHAGSRFPRPFAVAIGTLFENAKLIFPLWAVETASAAIFITSGTTGLIAVKSRLLLHEQFKRPLLALCEIHSGWVLSRLLRKFQQAAAGRRHGHSSSSDTSRYRLDPHSLSATYLSLAVTSMSALLPSGNVPTTRVRRRISRFSRSMALLVRMRRQCRMGKRV